MYFDGGVEALLPLICITFTCSFIGLFLISFFTGRQIGLAWLPAKRCKHSA